MGFVRPTAGNGPVTATCRRYGRTEISSPAIRPIDADQAPAQLNSSRVATSPADVRTPWTRPPATSTPFTSTPSFRRAPRRLAAAAYPEVTSGGPAVPSAGEN